MGALAWAEEEFGSARLGDERRTRRLVQMAAEVARRPAGTVTRACGSSASLEGAFRWLENPSIRSESVGHAVQQATLRRCTAEERVYVAIDATSLTLADEAKARDLGAVGTWTQGARGIHVMTALAVGAHGGVPLGICDQQMWVRKQRSKATAKGYLKDPYQRETRYWLDALENAHEAFQQLPDCRPFFQLDRGADCWPVLLLAQQHGFLLTVRAAHGNRRVDGAAQSLRADIGGAPLRARFRLQVPARGKIKKRQRVAGKCIHRVIQRRARVSTFTVRAKEVSLRAPNGEPFRINAVLVREHGRPADDRIEWLLLTSHPIATKADLRAIIHGYKQRWRVEEFHRTWKRGLCSVEDNQLRSRQAVFKWATILAAVASRAHRLTYLAREQPDALASDEFSDDEIRALIAMRQPRGIALDCVPTLGQAVRWVADLGGYFGPSNGPPGPTVIGRGLHDVLIAAQAIQNLQKMR